MTEYVRIPSLNLPADKIATLATIFPLGREATYWFGCRLAKVDPRLDQIQAHLAAWGMTPWRDHSRPRQDREFEMHFEREYAPEDLASCEFLEIHPPSEACNPGAIHRLESGEIVIPEKDMQGSGSDFQFGAPFTWYFVPVRVASLLEASGLKGIVLRPTLFIPAGDDAEPQSGEASPFRELDSGLTMPPLSPSMTFTDANGRPVQRNDFSNGFHRREGAYLHPELHYRAADLAALQPFDLARTYEPFGNRSGYDPFDRPLVASKRFYEFCIRRGLKTGWVPVRLDQ